MYLYVWKKGKQKIKKTKPGCKTPGFLVNINIMTNQELLDAVDGEYLNNKLSKYDDGFIRQDLIDVAKHFYEESYYKTYTETTVKCFKEDKKYRTKMCLIFSFLQITTAILAVISLII